jgi:hypothetical protein
VEIHPGIGLYPTTKLREKVGMFARSCQLWLIEQFVDELASTVFWRVVETHFAGFFF